VFRYSYVQCRLRALKLANALAECGMSAGAMAHPAVAMAAVVGVKHPKWQERPLPFIVRKLDQSLEGEEILVFLAERVAKWWIPDEVIFLDALPVGGTGKVQKALLREQYANHFS
jgi:fatty-acyl-CoA synthase